MFKACLQVPSPLNGSFDLFAGRLMGRMGLEPILPVKTTCHHWHNYKT